MSGGAISAHAQERAPSGGQPFAFHDAEFVSWWLASLYLFEPQDQLAIAQLLAEAVHAPDARRAIEDFVRIHTLEKTQVHDGSDEAPASTGTCTGIVFARLRELWNANPWMVVLGIFALTFFSGKAVLHLCRELVRIVF